MDDTLLAGATGLVGRELAALLAARHAHGGGRLHLLVRRPVAPPPGPPAVVHVVDFGALPRLPPAGLALCALGTTIAQAGSQAAFRAVDLDAVLAFARAAQAAGVRRFGVVSALGADPRSRTFYSRVKGEAEQALRGLGFEALVIARPSLLAGDGAGARAALGQPPRLAESLALALARPLGPLIPKALRPIKVAAVARGMLQALDTRPPGVHVLESTDLQDLGDT